jgi:hypothetical protein
MPPPRGSEYDHVAAVTLLMGKSRANEKDHPRTALRKPTLVVAHKPGEREDRSVARAVLRPEVQAGATLLCYSNGQPELTLDGMASELSAQCEAASKRDLTRSEALLTAQAHTLDGLFNNLARRAKGAQYLGQMEALLRLALKAQSQCRATIETLAEIKNPRAVAFVTQANIAHGPQQVNNGRLAPASAPTAYVPASGARELEREQNELLGGQDGERMDGRTAVTGSTAHPHVATLGEIDRAANVGRQKAREP